MLGWILWGQEWKKSEPNDSTRKNRLRYNRERTLQRYIITFAHAQISEYEYHIYTGSSPSLWFLFRFVGWGSGTIAIRIPDTVFEKKILGKFVEGFSQRVPSSLLHRADLRGPAASLRVCHGKHLDDRARGVPGLGGLLQRPQAPQQQRRAALRRLRLQRHLAL